MAIKITNHLIKNWGDKMKKKYFCRGLYFTALSAIALSFVICSDVFAENTEISGISKEQARKDDVASCSELAERYYQLELERVKVPAKTPTSDSKAKEELPETDVNMEDFRQACLYSIGKGSYKKDSAKATELFNSCMPSIKAQAEKGDPKAQIAMSTICKQLNNEKQAAEWLEQAALKGDMDSQYRIGLMYFAGACGVKQDQEKAFEYFKKAADQGSKFAAIRLAYMLREGIGVEKNVAKAKEYTKKIVRKNNK
jgi:TPR repeat protein